MSDRIALCIDELTCQNPGLIGLDGECLEAQSWLGIFSLGEVARKAICVGEGFAETWVVSCEDVEPINLAATLKEDKPDLVVRLVVPQGCGSLLSRAHTAGVDEVIDFRTLAFRYAKEKGRARERGVVALAAEPVVVADAETDTQPVSVDDPAGGADNTSTREGMDFAPDASASALSNASAVSSVVVSADRAAPADTIAPIDLPIATPVSSSVSQAMSENTVLQDADNAVSLEEEPSELQSAEKKMVASFQLPTDKNSHGFVMSVVSGSGGAGKSSVSVMAALVACDKGYRTLLLDYDLQFGDVALMMGAENPLTIDAAIAHPELVEREMRQDPMLTIVAAPNRLEAAEGVVSALPAFLDRVAPLFDVVVANTGAAWAEQHAALLERSYTSLFIVDQRVSSIYACKHALELCARCGIATGPFVFALNRCVKGAPLTSADVSSALQGVPVYEIKDGGREVENYLGAGSAIDLLHSGNELSESMYQLMEQLLPSNSRSSMQNSSRAGERPITKRRGFYKGRKRNKRSN